MAGVNSGSTEDNECDCGTTDQYARASYYYKTFIIPVIGSNENSNDFSNSKDFEGWNCGQITACGEIGGQICGGFNVKGTRAELTKTFYLPPGTYSVELDFIKIDSWFVCAIEWDLRKRESTPGVYDLVIIEYGLHT